MYKFDIGDYDGNRNADLTDFAAWQECMTGPTVPVVRFRRTPGSDSQSEIGNWESAIQSQAFDFNADGAIDLLDFVASQPLLASRSL